MKWGILVRARRELLCWQAVFCGINEIFGLFADSQPVGLFRPDDFNYPSWITIILRWL